MDKALLERLRELEQRLVALELDRRHDAERIDALEQQIRWMRTDISALENPQ